MLVRAKLHERDPTQTSYGNVLINIFTGINFCELRNRNPLYASKKIVIRRLFVHACTRYIESYKIVWHVNRMALRDVQQFPLGHVKEARDPTWAWATFQVYETVHVLPQDGCVVLEAEKAITTVEEKFECLTSSRFILKKQYGFCDVGEKTFSPSQWTLQMARATLTVQIIIYNHFKAKFKPILCRSQSIHTLWIFINYWLKYNFVYRRGLFFN